MSRQQSIVDTFTTYYDPTGIPEQECNTTYDAYWYVFSSGAGDQLGISHIYPKKQFFIDTSFYVFSYVIKFTVSRFYEIFSPGRYDPTCGIVGTSNHYFNPV